MKVQLLIFTFLVFHVSLKAQDQFERGFQEVRSELTNWDPVRGEWLSASLVSISKRQPVPNRSFPEDLTPAEMLKLVPEKHRVAINQIISDNQRVASDSTGRNEWNSIASITQRSACNPVMARSYGDPHLSSFDGATYSFQTVGEFILAKSTSQNLEIQTRQQAQSDDFSLNTAVAMNVGGDRVCIYANEKPDNISNIALRLEGSPIQFAGSTYFLPHGGTLRYSSNTYIITWPTGETAFVELKNSIGMNFLNIAVQVNPCSQNDFQGLLGNANGREQDDFDLDNGLSLPMYGAFSSFGNSQLEQASNAAEKEYLAFLARDFARSYRITQTNSLFDYGFGQNTFSFTDESFPRVHRTVGDLSNDRQILARKKCEDQGVRGSEIKGCIFDQAYLDIQPSPKPTITDRTNGLVLRPLIKPAKETNTKPIIEREASKEQPEATSNPQTISKPIIKEVDKSGSFPSKENTTVISNDTRPTNTNAGSVSKPAENSTKPATEVIKPSGTNTKPSGAAGSPTKTGPTIKSGKGL